MQPALAYHEYLRPAIFEPMAQLTLAIAQLIRMTLAEAAA